MLHFQISDLQKFVILMIFLKCYYYNIVLEILQKKTILGRSLYNEENRSIIVGSGKCYLAEKPLHELIGQNRDFFVEKSDMTTSIDITYLPKSFHLLTSEAGNVNMFQPFRDIFLQYEYYGIRHFIM
ncbi:hypothetical protein BD770DRAFT_428389 [Pilaira anomala]|nr:hypothetical protein BD770DRAFT_428389 [Pilaira anomala]